MITVTASMVEKSLPALAEDAYKYSRGVCNLVVGSPLYAGAGILAARAANVMGAGYTRVYSCDEVAQSLHVVQPSTVVKAYKDCLDDDINWREGHSTALVLGCGLDTDCSQTPLSFIEQIIKKTVAPLVIDGGGLSFFAQSHAREVMLDRASHGLTTVVTPHQGEAARFAVIESGAGIESVMAVQNPEAFRCLTIAQTYQVICVFKGPRTYIACPFMTSVDDVYCMDKGTAVLAKAGTGDVLAGMLGSLLAQGVPADQAACAATFIHARAGRCAESTQGICTTTEDVLSCIPAAVSSLS